MNRVRAAYDYDIHITPGTGNKFIIITDLNRGMSVTNDIENVVDEISRKENTDPRQCRIVYRDSQGQWDGWDDEKQIFIPLNTRNSLEALLKINDYYNENKKTSQEEAGNSHTTKL